MITSVYIQLNVFRNLIMSRSGQLVVVRLPDNFVSVNYIVNDTEYILSTRFGTAKIFKSLRSLLTFFVNESVDSAVFKI